MERASRRNYHYIYKTTCKITNRFYIGMHSTDDLDDGYIGSGKRLWYSIKKHGRENHFCEILEFLPDRISLKLREKELVNEELLKDTQCMNLVPGGEGGYISKEGVKKGRNITDNILREKFGNNFQSVIIKNYHNSLTDEEKKQHNEKIRLGITNSSFDFSSIFKGKKHKDVTKMKIGEKNAINQKGDKNSQFGTCWITNGVENKKIKKGDIIPDGWELGRK